MKKIVKHVLKNSVVAGALLAGVCFGGSIGEASTELQNSFDSQLQSSLDSELQSSLNSQLQSSFNSLLQSKHEAQVESQFNSEAQVDLQAESQISTQVKSEVDTLVQGVVKASSSVNAETNVNQDTSVRTETNSSVHSSTILDTEADIQLDADLKVHPNVSTDTDVDADLKAHPNEDAEVYVKAKAKTNAERSNKLHAAVDSTIRACSKAELEVSYKEGHLSTSAAGRVHADVHGQVYTSSETVSTSTSQVNIEKILKVVADSRADLNSFIDILINKLASQNVESIQLEMHNEAQVQGSSN